MGEDDVQGIRADLAEVKGGLAGLTAAVADLRVLVAGNYVTKTDFKDCQECSEARVVAIHKKNDDNKEDVEEKINNAVRTAKKDLDDYKIQESANRWKLASVAAALGVAALSFLQWLYGVLKGGGQNL